MDTELIPIVQDRYGPEYVVRVHDPELGMTGFLVVDNTALGPGKGGIRMTPNVTPEEVFRLARTMTWKNSLAGIPFGGAKAGIVWNGGSDDLKKKFIQSFARALKPLLIKKYIAGPDVNTGEREMQWFVEAVGNWRAATGKPANLCIETFTPAERGKPRTRASTVRGKCGIPHEFGSTGFGVAHAARVAAEYAKLPIRGATVAIHGFGNVGTFAYKFLTEMGARVTAIADIHGAAFRRDGFEPKIMNKIIDRRAPLMNYRGAKKISDRDFWATPVDILIPASVTDVITDRNKNLIRAKVIVEGGNIPMREPIEQELWRKKKIVIVPDFVANAGGVISSYAEYRGYNPKRMFEIVEKRIVAATTRVLKESMRTGKHSRTVAMALAVAKVEQRISERARVF